MQKSRKLSEVSAYVTSYALSNYVWRLVMQWDYFSKKTLGEQFVTATDSISANIAEGFGRWSKKDRIKFYRYSFGSVYECLDWNEKAFNRQLITQQEHDYLLQELRKLPREINILIRYTNTVLAI